jgi:NTE family protein
MRTVAIACQGGGSHTAFTGGALQRLLADEDHRVVALSGTSGARSAPCWPGTAC